MSNDDCGYITYCKHFPDTWNQEPCNKCTRNPFVKGEKDHYEGENSLELFKRVLQDVKKYLDKSSESRDIESNGIEYDIRLHTGKYKLPLLKKEISEKRYMEIRDTIINLMGLILGFSSGISITLMFFQFNVYVIFLIYLAGIILIIFMGFYLARIIKLQAVITGPVVLNNGTTEKKEEYDNRVL